MFSDGYARWREWRLKGLLRVTMWECVLVVAEEMDGYREGMLEEKKFGCKTSKRMVHDRSIWWGFVRGNAWSVSRGINHSL